MARNRIVRAWDSIRGRDAALSAGRGGYRNPLSGAGYGADKGAHSFFVPTLHHSRQQLETIYVESWAAAKFIDILVDDLFIRGRSFDGDDEAAVAAMRQATSRHDASGRLARAIKMGRLYGTGLLLMVTREAPLDEPLVVERIREEDLLSLLPVDRYDAQVEVVDEDFFSASYGQPLVYRIMDKVSIHASRVLRFDGIRPLGVGWSAGYESRWGVSELVPVMTSISQDAGIAQGIAHLAQEASMLVVKMQGYRDALAGEETAGGPEDVTPAQIGERMNLDKSLYRTIFTDVDSDIGRIGVAWSGLPELLDRFAHRLAAAADIPATRFYGQSPVGMNATGESDMRNYAMRVAAMQERLITEPLSRLDAVLARDAGLTGPPPYHWLSLMDLSEQDQAAVSKTRAEAVNLALVNNLVDEDEGRAALNGDPLFGELEPLDGVDADAKPD